MMKIRHMLTLLLTLLFTSSAFAQPIEGIWNSMVSSPMGEFVVVFDFDSNGSELTGTMSMDMMGMVPISEGVINGNEFSFKVSMQGGPGGAMDIVYTGNITGDTLNMTSTIQGPPPPGGEAEQKMTAVRTQL